MRGTMNTRRFKTALYQAWLRFQYDRRAQDMIEYAMLAASAAAVISAVFPQALTSNLKHVIWTVRGYLKVAAGTRKSFDNIDPGNFFD